MRQAKIIDLVKFEPHTNDNPEEFPIIKVVTDYAYDKQNSFYMDAIDNNGHSVDINTNMSILINTSDVINLNDQIFYNKQEGINKVVIWKNHKFRQRGYSFNGR